MRSYGSNLNGANNNLRIDFLQKWGQLMLVIAAAAVFMALVMSVWLLLAPDAMRAAYSQRLASAQTELVTNQRPLVGIVVGHAGFDPGAVCPDGLTEVEVNEQVAKAVVVMLNSRGVDTDLLEEFDARLSNYQADALVSIHADSCTVAGVTGYKVARVTLSAIPEAEDRLVTCLINEYGKITGLPEHSSSITDGMTNYHAFREIASITPGAIIETGFLLEDRAILADNPQLVARGIASGIFCFLKSTNNG